MSVSGTYRPPYGPKWPSGSGRRLAERSTEVGLTDGGNELPLFLVILASRAHLPPAADIHAVGSHPAHGQAHGVRPQAPGEDDPHVALGLQGQVPRNRGTRPARLPFHEGVQQEGVGWIRREEPQTSRVPHPDRL